MKCVLFTLLCLFSYSPIVMGQSWEINAGYNKTQLSQTGGLYLQTSFINQQAFKLNLGFEQLGLIEYQENFGTLSYPINQLSIGTGYQIQSFFESLKFNANINGVFSFSSVKLSRPLEEVNGNIVRAFYPGIQGLINSQLNIFDAFSFTLGAQFQSPYLLSNNPVQTSFKIGLAYTVKQKLKFNDKPAFFNLMDSTKILQTIKTCYLCDSDFYSLLIGKFQTIHALKDALKQRDIFLLVSTEFYLSHPQSFFFAHVNGEYYLYFGEFNSIKQSNFWKQTFNQHYKIEAQAFRVGLFNSNQQTQLLPIRSLLY
ncbi:hypothetical protein [Marinicellulosiphila megalodicopiae]|uniref:hypothetical protein n=1 Tax=Marinicellulosiphila megalodicopiae TaxID=2724896 RepID=UPI003BAF120B